MYKTYVTFILSSGERIRTIVETDEKITKGYDLMSHIYSKYNHNTLNIFHAKLFSSSKHIAINLNRVEAIEY